MSIYRQINHILRTKNKLCYYSKVMTKKQISDITKFFYEMGTLRKIARSHRQSLLTDDLSDNIASHTFRVCMIGMMLAQVEKADVSKVVLMCLLHDISET